MKRNLILIYILFLGILLAACGSGATNQTAEDTQKENANKQDLPDPENNKQENLTEEKDSSYADILRDGLPELTEWQAELSDESYNYINDNSRLFPATAEEAIKEAKSIAESIDVRLLNKNIQPYFSTMLTFNGTAVQVEEDHYEGEVAARINVYDNGRNHIVIIFKSTGDILEEDYVRFWGVPIANYYYETLDGGGQQGIVYFASHIEKDSQ